MKYLQIYYHFEYLPIYFNRPYFTIQIISSINEFVCRMCHCLGLLLLMIGVTFIAALGLL